MDDLATRGLVSAAMGIESQFLARLKSEQIERSLKALTKPKDETLFGYGRAVGYQLGLARAEQLLGEVLKGEESDRTEG